MRAIVTRHWERSTGIEHGNRRLACARCRLRCCWLLLSLRLLLSRVRLRAFVTASPCNPPAIDTPHCSRSRGQL
jgi:hypothetical protein